MTDARASALHAEVLVGGTPRAQVSSVHAEVLIGTQTLTSVNVSLVAAEVLVGRTHSRWDGSTLQSDVSLYWWDGAELQPAKVLGWWDGADIQQFVPR